MSGTASAISSYSRVEIMRVIQQRSQRPIADLIDATGLHPNTVREHLQRLIDAGYVVAETERRTTRGRPRVLYSAATADTAVSEVAVRKARDAARRGDLLRRVFPDEASADLPDDALHQLDALVEDLADAGFDPVVDTEALTVDLTPCPHAPDAAHRGTLCAVHVGLMDGVLAQAGGPLHVDGIAASCDPTHCVVRLGLDG